MGGVIVKTSKKDKQQEKRLKAVPPAVQHEINLEQQYNKQQFATQCCTNYSTDPRYNRPCYTQATRIAAIFGGVSHDYTKKTRNNNDYGNIHWAGEQIDKDGKTRDDA